MKDDEDIEIPAIQHQKRIFCPSHHENKMTAEEETFFKYSSNFEKNNTNLIFMSPHDLTKTLSPLLSLLFILSAAARAPSKAFLRAVEQENFFKPRRMERRVAPARPMGEASSLPLRQRRQQAALVFGLKVFSGYRGIDNPTWRRRRPRPARPRLTLTEAPTHYWRSHR